MAWEKMRLEAQRDVRREVVMNEEQFRDGLIRIARYSDYKEKESVLLLLKRAYVTFDKTNKFTKKTWQFYENVEIRIAPEYKNELEKHQDILKLWCEELYEETKSYNFGVLKILNGTKNVEIPDEIDVCFEHQQEKLIEEIRQAKYVIWVAVAWFTDPVLFSELIEKKKQGVNIQVIVDADEINRKGGLEYEKYFESYRMPLKGYFDNIVHHKFCIIDFETVVHGSYNWTKKAQYNRETLEVVNSREQATKFADEFISLKTRTVW